MSRSARTPVLVGVGVVQQREDDPAHALEPLALMGNALERAAHDAGSLALLARADSIRVPRGFWDYADPGRALAERFGAAKARTSLAEVGVLQTTLLGTAARDIAEGRADVVLVAGGEARHRAQRAQQRGALAPLTRQAAGVVPDEVLRPHAEIIHPLERQVGPGDAGVAVRTDRERAALRRGALARRAPRRRRRAPGARERRGGEESRLRGIAHRTPPARSAGPGAATACSPSRTRSSTARSGTWIRPPASCSVRSRRRARSASRRRASSIRSRPPTRTTCCRSRRARRCIACPASRTPAASAFEGAGLAAAELRHLELYSCFPVAVRVQARELGIAETRPLTVTGGMTFAGGPLNNFVLQALAKLAEVLRADPGSAGLLTAVSGILTKQGVTLWSTRPPERDFAFHDVTPETAREQVPVPLVEEFDGPARVAGYTVLFEGERAARSAFVCDLDDGRRTLAASDDPELAELGTREELCGRALRLAGDRATLA